MTDSSSEVSPGVNWPVNGENAETLQKSEVGRDGGGERIAKVVGRFTTRSLLASSDLFRLCILELKKV